MTKCLSCYEPLPSGTNQEYHDKCSKRIFGIAKAPVLEYNMDQLRDLAGEVLRHRTAIPGVQPKLSLALDKATKGNPTPRLTIVGLWDGTYVLKPTHTTYKELPENEDVTMHMADACGIRTAVHSLIRFKSGELAYIAKRFDRLIKREKVEKLHQEDMCQLTGLLTENKYNSSMEKVAKTVYQHTTNNGLEVLSLFQLTVFSFLTGNSDMHLKNFSLLKNVDGRIENTPAYDLLATRLVLPEDGEQLALTLNGKKNKISRVDFDQFAKHCKISAKAADNVFRDLESKLKFMKEWLTKSFLSASTQRSYLSIVEERAATLLIQTPPNFSKLTRGGHGAGLR